MKVLLFLREDLIYEVIRYAMESRIVSASSMRSVVEGDEVDIAFPGYVHKMERCM